MEELRAAHMCCELPPRGLDGKCSMHHMANVPQAGGDVEYRLQYCVPDGAGGWLVKLERSQTTPEMTQPIVYKLRTGPLALELMPANTAADATAKAVLGSLPPELRLLGFLAPFADEEGELTVLKVKEQLERASLLGVFPMQRAAEIFIAVSAQLDVNGAVDEIVRGDGGAISREDAMEMILSLAKIPVVSVLAIQVLIEEDSVSEAEAAPAAAESS
eukprot:SAG22_NODE_229_length_14598_cov_13.257052_8_plen_217_part_00